MEIVKNQIYNVYTIFLDEFDKLEAKSNEKIEHILARYKILEERMTDIENSIDKIEGDIYINQADEYDFDITCPYCGTEFSVDYSDELKDSVVCPECNHTIELDWNENENGECSHDCNECDNDCDNIEDDDDDM